jgi:dimethylamine/trimethylamine dehydrogenase
MSHRVQRRLLELDVRIVPHRTLSAVAAGRVETACTFTGRCHKIETDGIVMVTGRLPVNELASALEARKDEWADAGLLSVQTIGDALAPGTIAAAVFSGRRHAEELGTEPDENRVPFRREVAELLPLGDSHSGIPGSMG